VNREEGELSPQEIMELEEWGRRVRREMADWDFIRRQPPKLREALICLIETGDLYLASRIAGMSIGKFNELRIRAKIPVT